MITPITINSAMINCRFPRDSQENMASLTISLWRTLCHFVQCAIRLALGALLCINTMVLAVPTVISNSPVANTITPPSPNIMFILDASGSMSSDYGSDLGVGSCRNFYDGKQNLNFGTTYQPQATDCGILSVSIGSLPTPVIRSFAFNAMAYNPEIRYRPGVYYDGSPMPDADPAAANTEPYSTFATYGGGIITNSVTNLLTSYKDYQYCPDTITLGSLSLHPACVRNDDNTYPNSAFARVYELDTAAYYYVAVPVQYCTDKNLKQCVNATSPTTVMGVDYNVPALARWCDFNDFTQCQAKQISPFMENSISGFGASAIVNIPVGFSMGGGVPLPMISVNGVAIFHQSKANIISTYNTPSSVANQYCIAINESNRAGIVPGPIKWGCDYVSNGIKIFAFGSGEAAGHTVTVEQVGANPVIAPVTMAGERMPHGKLKRVDIIPANAPFPKGPGRTDCAGATCTYQEEIQNFANWYTYYRTRINMMKTVLGRVFSKLDASTRVGFITIRPHSVSNNVAVTPVLSTRYLAIDNFTPGSGQQRENWYNKMYGAYPSGSTFLREALSRVGRYYANKGTEAIGAAGAISAGMGPSPIQSSCQRNYAILSTDGYWNAGIATSISTPGMSNQDGALGTGPNQVPRPLYDPSWGVTGATLADVARYYYATDLRPDLADQVQTLPKDPATHQHMVTFTVGLGVDGTLEYERNYETSTTGDFYKLKQGTLDWPYPPSFGGDPTTVDDLWHAAVNGHGKYFSAKNPQDVIDGLTEALQAIAAINGAGAAVATSSLQPVAGDNFAFTAAYTTGEWTSDLTAHKLDLNTGLLSATKEWSAQALLESHPYASRNIWLPGTGGSGLKAFQWSNLSAIEQAYFDPTTQMTQAAGWSPGQQSTATGETLVNYLRGDRAYDITLQLPTPNTDLYRRREKILGDIVNAQPTYMRISPLSYNDRGFSEFKGCTAGTLNAAANCPSGLSPSTPRAGTVFAGANDGMLHAFETEGANPGEERWAFIPSMVLPNLHKLASTNYIANHRYFVDGTPVIGDICVAADCQAASVNGANWRTILVGGLNAGGRGFYALDITNPSATEVKLLWEFKVRDAASCAAPVVGSNSDCDLGYSFGNPIITKRKSDGKWVVLVTSGYNNYAPGDGNGYLYVLEAATGKVLNKIGLPASAGASGGSPSPLCGSAYCDAEPLGLAKINISLAYNVGDNTALYAYGGDLKGNLWRFDLTDVANSYPAPALVATLKDSNGDGQPITTRPEIGMVQTNTPVVFVGTGKILGAGDLANAQQQTIYAIRADSTSPIDPRGGDLVQQTLSSDTAVADGTIRTVTSTNTVDWATQKGWYVDLPNSGERVNVDPSLQVGTLVVASNIPSTDPCTAGGYGYLNQFDFKTGKAVETAANLAVSQKITTSQIAGISVVKLPGNKLVTITTTTDNQRLAYDTPVTIAGAGGKRVSWREIIIDN